MVGGVADGSVDKRKRWAGVKMPRDLAKEENKAFPGPIKSANLTENKGVYYLSSQACLQGKC